MVCRCTDVGVYWCLYIENVLHPSVIFFFHHTFQFVELLVIFIFFFYPSLSHPSVSNTHRVAGLPPLKSTLLSRTLLLCIVYSEQQIVAMQYTPSTPTISVVGEEIRGQYVPALFARNEWESNFIHDKMHYLYYVFHTNIHTKSLCCSV